MSTTVKGKPISLSHFATWPDEIKQAFHFEENETKTKYNLALCILCSKHSKTISNTCKGRIATDIENYGNRGTVHLLLPNLQRHLASNCHQKALELEHGSKPPPNQSSLEKTFVRGEDVAITQCVQLMKIAWFVCDGERPFTDFPKIVTLFGESGVSLPGSYTDNNACKAFAHLLANEMKEDVRTHVRSSNFVSFLVDGSTVYKRKLSHEGELVYLRTANGLIPKVEFFDFVSMAEYVRVSADNLTHAVKRTLLSALSANMVDSESVVPECSHAGGDCDCSLLPKSNTPINLLNSELENLKQKIIGGSADGAAVNFGCRKGLMTQIHDKIPWFVAIHCLSHRLELAMGEALKDTKFEGIDSFLDSMFFHFRNSPAEWMGLQATADTMGCRVTQPPKSSGTRFVSFRLRALEALMINWAVLVVFFSDQVSSKTANADKARGYLRDLLDGLFMTRCWAYKDILNASSKACQALQASKTQNIAHALTKISTMKVDLAELVTEPGENEKNMKNILQTSPQAENPVLLQTRTRQLTEAAGMSDMSDQKAVCLPLKKRQKVRKRNKAGEIVDLCDTFMCEEPFVVRKCSPESLETVCCERAVAVENIIKASTERFSEFENHTNVLSHLGWLHVLSWPVCNSNKPTDAELKQIKTFQNEDLEAVVQHFETPLKASLENFSAEKALRQFKDLKLTRALSNTIQNIEPDAYWPYVYKCEKNKEDIFLVVELVMALPFSEAIVESGFSAKARILSDWRTTLSHQTITDLLHFSTRKGESHNVKRKQELVVRAATKFVSGKGPDCVPGRGLSLRRVKKLCSLMQCSEDSGDESVRDCDILADSCGQSPPGTDINTDSDIILSD